MATAIRRQDLLDPWTGEELPPLLSLDDTCRVLRRSRTSVTHDLERGVLPAMPHIKGAPWQVPTAKLLRQLGLLEGSS